MSPGESGTAEAAGIGFGERRQRVRFETTRLRFAPDLAGDGVDLIS
jgi:hypothetical protein